MMAVMLAQVSAATPPPSAMSGYGMMLARSLATLVGVCLLAWWVLRWAAQRGVGGRTAGGVMRVRERLPLDVRHTMYLVEVGRRKLLLGAGEHGLTTLAELEDGDLHVVADPTAVSTRGAFAEALARWRGGPEEVEIVPPPKLPIDGD